MHQLNIAEYCLKSNAQRFPHKNALVIVDELNSERKITYQELYNSVYQ